MRWNVVFCAIIKGLITSLSLPSQSCIVTVVKSCIGNASADYSATTIERQHSSAQFFNGTASCEAC